MNSNKQSLSASTSSLSDDHHCLRGIPRKPLPRTPVVTPKQQRASSPDSPPNPSTEASCTRETSEIETKLTLSSSPLCANTLRTNTPIKRSPSPSFHPRHGNLFPPRRPIRRSLYASEQIIDLDPPTNDNNISSLADSSSTQQPPPMARTRVAIQGEPSAAKTIAAPTQIPLLTPLKNIFEYTMRAVYSELTNLRSSCLSVLGGESLKDRMEPQPQPQYMKVEEDEGEGEVMREREDPRILDSFGFGGSKRSREEDEAPVQWAQLPSSQSLWTIQSCSHEHEHGMFNLDPFESIHSSESIFFSSQSCRQHALPPSEAESSSGIRLSRAFGSVTPTKHLPVHSSSSQFQYSSEFPDDDVPSLYPYDFERESSESESQPLRKKRRIFGSSSLEDLAPTYFVGECNMATSAAAALVHSTPDDPDSDYGECGCGGECECDMDGERDLDSDSEYTRYHSEFESETSTAVTRREYFYFDEVKVKKEEEDDEDVWLTVPRAISTFGIMRSPEGDSGSRRFGVY